MVKLSDRLMRLAAEVQPGDRAADIGTDHGLLPIFLWENGIASHVILCDINRGPLEKARENIARFGADLSDLRQGDGLAPVSPGEVDTVIIAGMGGILIADILRSGRQTAQSCKRLVLQPRSKSEVLRRFLRENGYRIIRESLVSERDEICQIITAVPDAEQKGGGDFQIESQPLADEVSPLLFQKGDPLLIPFLERKIYIEETIIKRIGESTDLIKTEKSGGVCGADGGAGGEAGEERGRRLALARERLAVFSSLLRKAREKQ